MPGLKKTTKLVDLEQLYDANIDTVLVLSLSVVWANLLLVLKINLTLTSTNLFLNLVPLPVIGPVSR